MSSNYIPTTQGGRYTTLQWINATTQMHDTFCECKQPIQHLLKGIRETSIGLTPQEKEELKICLGDTTVATTDQVTIDPEDILDGVDLDAFFQEDFGDPAVDDG